MIKQMLLCLLLSCMSIAGFTQDSTISLSKFEQFSTRQGRLFRTDTKEVGRNRDIWIYKVKTTDLETGESRSALRIQQSKMVLFTILNAGVIYIDLDELEGVNKSLSFYHNEINKGRPSNELVFSYITSNDIQVNCSYNEGGVGGWFVSLSQRYKHLKSTVPNSTILLKSKDIDNFVAVMKQGAETE